MSASTDTLYFNNAPYDNQIDLINRVLEVYSVSTHSNKLMQLKMHEIEVLSYYVRNGVSAETFEMVLDDRGIDISYLHVINSKLKKKGYLVGHKKNYHKFDLSDDLQAIRKVFVIDKSEVYMIKFGKA